MKLCFLAIINILLSLMYKFYKAKNSFLSYPHSVIFFLSENILFLFYFLPRTPLEIMAEYLFKNNIFNIIILKKLCFFA